MLMNYIWMLIPTKFENLRQGTPQMNRTPVWICHSCSAALWMQSQAARAHSTPENIVMTSRFCWRRSITYFSPKYVAERCNKTTAHFLGFTNKYHLDTTQKLIRNGILFTPKHLEVLFLNPLWKQCMSIQDSEVPQLCLATGMAPLAEKCEVETC